MTPIYLSNMTKERKDIIRRLKIIRGHLSGVIEMVEDERECEDILIQMQAIHSSLNKAKHIIIENSVKNCLLQDQDKLPERLEQMLKYLTK